MEFKPSSSFILVCLELKAWPETQVTCQTSKIFRQQLQEQLAGWAGLGTEGLEREAG